MDACAGEAVSVRLAAAAVTGGNPFGSMMQAWKYSLPAFLVPFLFSASKEGANLLIVGATTVGFVQALINSLFALAFLSVAIVGHLGGPITKLERAVLTVVACVMVVDPLELSILGILPVAIGSVVIFRYVAAARSRRLPPSPDAPAV